MINGLPSYRTNKINIDTKELNLTSISDMTSNEREKKIEKDWIIV